MILYKQIAITHMVQSQKDPKDKDLCKFWSLVNFAYDHGAPRDYQRMLNNVLLKKEKYEKRASAQAPSPSKVLSITQPPETVTQLFESFGFKSNNNAYFGNEENLIYAYRPDDNDGYSHVVCLKIRGNLVTVYDDFEVTSFNIFNQADRDYLGAQYKLTHLKTDDSVMLSSMRSTFYAKAD